MGRIKWVPMSEDTKKELEKPIISVGMIPDLSSDEPEPKTETPPEQPSPAEEQQGQPETPREELDPLIALARLSDRGLVPCSPDEQEHPLEEDEDKT